MKITISLTPAVLKSIKGAARTIIPEVRSAHLSEAIAAGFGYRTQVALKTALETYLQGSTALAVTIDSTSDAAAVDRLVAMKAVSSPPAPFLLRAIRAAGIPTAESALSPEPVKSLEERVNTRMRSLSDAILAMVKERGTPTSEKSATGLIPAECHTDDHVVRIDFDAKTWFEQASDGEIFELWMDDWGFDYSADRVARFYADSTLSSLFEYLSHRPRMSTGDTVGFECSIDAKHAMAWVKANRPSALALMREIEPDETDNFEP